MRLLSLVVGDRSGGSVQGFGVEQALVLARVALDVSGPVALAAASDMACGGDEHLE